MAAKKKSAKKKSAKKAAKKKAAKKAVTSKPAKKAAKKKAAVKKKAAAKKKVAARKKAAAPKQAASRSKATSSAKPKAAATKPKARRAAKASSARKKSSAKSSAPLETGVVPRESDDGAMPTDERPADTPPGRPAAGGLRRGTRRQVGPRRRSSTAARYIPPLPDDDDDFIPETPTRNEDPSPATLLDRVRKGRAHISAMSALSDTDVRTLAEEAGLSIGAKDTTRDIIYRLVNEERRPVNEDRGPKRRTPAGRRVEQRERESVAVEGLLELHPDGYGFLRRSERNYSQHPEDVYVAAGVVRRLGLQPGHWIAGHAHRPRPGQAYLALHEVDEVNHENPSVLENVTPFKELTVVHPDVRLPLETGPDDMEMRVMDLFCPLGMGQRALIVAPPRTGKTILLTKLADAIATNSPNVDIVVLLVDERPEEVTNMSRSVRGEVIASTFDKPATNHVRVAELVMDKVRRMVEFGRDVVLLLDSITRLGRAYNNQSGGSGRILSGGLDANALSKPKRFFGSARNVEGGGSLTIVATALVDTGSKMDQVIFEEFKGTGNMEVVLSRDLSNARVWPAIDVPASGTRNEELLLHPDELQRVVMLRRGITGQDPLTVMEALRTQLRKHSTNAQFLMGLGESAPR